MWNLLRSHHPVRRINSFKYALEGILHALKNEANFRIQIVICVVVVWLGFHFRISTSEWGLLIVSLSSLLSAEILNTVVEEVMDKLMPKNDYGVKIIKDLAAGFVLTTAAPVLLILILIFASKV